MTEFKTELEKFDPTVNELQTIASEAAKITVTDIRDKEQVELASKKRKELKQHRVNITKIGKSLRDDANAFNKAVLTKEKELLAIITPEEDRLLAIEDEAAKVAEMDKRRALLPERIEKLTSINDGQENPSEDEMLAMDDASFTSYFNDRVAAKNEADRLEMERKAEEERLAKEEADRKEADRKAEEQRKADEEAARIKEEQEAERRKIEEEKAELERQRREVEHQKELAEAEAKAKEEAERRAKEEAERKERDAKEAEAARIKEEERRKAEEAEQEKKNKDYKAFLKECKYDQETDKVERDGNKSVVWRKVSEFNWN